MSLRISCLAPHPPLLIPGVAKREVALVEKTTEGMKKLAERVVASSPEVILFVSPHGRLFRDAFGVYSRPFFEGNMGKFGQAGISYRAEGFPRLAQAIASASSEAGLPVVFSDQNAPIPLDHGILVPLHFLREAGYQG
ncbi:MAG TPA: hypothetical protein V6C82_06365, partial [Chroococcales cyanobacterium]